MGQKFILNHLCVSGSWRLQKDVKQISWVDLWGIRRLFQQSLWIRLSGISKVKIHPIMWSRRCWKKMVPNNIHGGLLPGTIKRHKSLINEQVGLERKRLILDEHVTVSLSFRKWSGRKLWLMTTHGTWSFGTFERNQENLACLEVFKTSN